jgi:hypothetical protein
MMSRMLMNALVAGLSFLAHAMRDALTFSPLVCSLSLSLGVFPMKEFDVYLMIDENGDYVVHKEEPELGDAYESEIGNEHCLARRIVKVSLKASLPKTVALVGVVPDDATDGVLTVA